MMEVQKQWKNVNGSWQQVEVPVPAATTQDTERPALSVRTATTPRLPPRPSAPRNADTVSTDKTPALPPRRPSEQALSRRESDESVRSSATTETSLSFRSNGTSFSSDRYTIRAPDYDPSSLPKLPPRRTQEEKDAQARVSRYPVKAPKKTSISGANTRAPLTAHALERSQTQPPPSLPGRGNLPEEIEAVQAIPTPKDVPTKTIVSSGLPPGAFRLPAFDRTEAPARTPPPTLPKRQPPFDETPALPKRQPNVPALPQRQTVEDTPPVLPGRQSDPAIKPTRQIVPPPAKRSALSMGFDTSQTPTARDRPGIDAAKQPSLPTRPSKTSATPPPIPLASRPDLTALLASKPKPDASAPLIASAGNCLTCRNFTAPDEHAARFPRASLPSYDIGWLAHQLTDPFPSLTDKARAIFTWLHHNVAYDVEAFFGNNVKPATPQSTLSTGLAVCAGYAGLFVALALKAGLEAIECSGHGRGFGDVERKLGDPVPPYSLGHAWNAVKIDGGFWKLVDPCWGAGIVQGAGQPYKKRFAPENFTKSNEDFGLSHFPAEARFQYRSDGRVLQWEEYIMGKKSGTGAATFNGYLDEEGIRPQTILPAQNPIVLADQGPTVRFSFQTVCPHYEPSKVGKPAYMLYVMIIDGLDGTDRNYPACKRKDGIWWCDIPTRDLGRAGQKATLCAVTPWNDGDAHGLTFEQYERGKRNGKHAFGFVAQWTLA